MSTIATDLPCLGCGYNLRGLDASGACPECGKPAVESTQGDRLEFADIGWLRNVRLGVTLGALVLLVGLARQIALNVVIHIMQTPLGGTVYAVAITTMMAAAAGLSLGSGWLITMRQPHESHDPRWTLRRWARAGVIAATVVVAVQFTMSRMVSGQSMAFWTAQAIGPIILGGSACLIMALLYAIAARMRHGTLGLWTLIAAMAILVKSAADVAYTIYIGLSLSSTNPSFRHLWTLNWTSQGITIASLAVAFGVFVAYRNALSGAIRRAVNVRAMLREQQQAHQ